MRSRRLKGFPQPRSDETLSSWLLRCALSRRCALNLEDVENYVEFSKNNRIDYDFSLGHVFRRFCSRFGIDYLYCKAFFAVYPKDMMMTVSGRNSFCSECLDEDVKHRGFPYWRRSWCRFDVAYCAIHGTLLTTTRENYGLYRSWDSFAYFSSFEYARRGDRLRYEHATLSFLGLKVQNWLRINRRYVCANARIAKLISDLLGSFLSLRTESRYCGHARVALSYGRLAYITYRNYHYSSCMYYGVRDSNSIQRKAALIMLGVVLGLFTELQVRNLTSSAALISGPFPKNPKQAGATVLAVLREPEKDWYTKLFLDIPQLGDLDINARLEEFLAVFQRPDYDP
jgi:hypothetical protein